MFKATYINLPIKNVERSRSFFGQLGFHFVEEFSAEDVLCMKINDSTYAMLLTEEKLLDFTKRPFPDFSKITHATFALQVETKASVDAFIDNALANGGKFFMDTIDYDFMYSRSFEDLDGHMWEIVWMAPFSAEGEV